MSVGDYVRTVPNKIFVSPGMLNTIGTGLLVHELTHCAQYQHGVSIVVTATHAVFATYDYGGEQGLTDAIKARKCYTSFNTEQQADIVQDYYLRAASSERTYPWSVFIDQVRANGACVWPNNPSPEPEVPPPPNQG